MIIAGTVKKISLEKLGDWNESEFVITLEVANTELSFPIPREEVGNYRVDEFAAFDLKTVRLVEINKTSSDKEEFSQALYDREVRDQEMQRRAGIKEVQHKYIDEDYDDIPDQSEYDEPEENEEGDEIYPNNPVTPLNSATNNTANTTETYDDIMNEKDEEIADEELAARLGKRQEDEIDNTPVVAPRVSAYDPGTITDDDLRKEQSTVSDPVNDIMEPKKENTESTAIENDNTQEDLPEDDTDGETIDDLGEDETDDDSDDSLPSGGLFGGNPNLGEPDDEDYAE